MDITQFVQIYIVQGIVFIYCLILGLKTVMRKEKMEILSNWICWNIFFWT